MKQINYTMVVRNIGQEATWKEPMSEYVDDNVTVKERAEQIIANFNKTLRFNEMPRELVEVIETDQVGKANHVWEKASLITEKGGYDRHKCKVCGATGKRHGLNSGIAIDDKFKKFQFCPGMSTKL